MAIRGPEATAGSIPNYLKVMGTRVPTMLDTAMATSRAAPMQKAADNAKLHPRSHGVVLLAGAVVP